jgi:hypothetical protein
MGFRGMAGITKSQRTQAPNQALHLTGAARLVSRGMIVLQRPRQVSLIVLPDASRPGERGS